MLCRKTKASTHGVPGDPHSSDRREQEERIAARPRDAHAWFPPARRPEERVFADRSTRHRHGVVRTPGKPLDPQTALHGPRFGKTSAKWRPHHANSAESARRLTRWRTLAGTRVRAGPVRPATAKAGLLAPTGARGQQADAPALQRKPDGTREPRRGAAVEELARSAKHTRPGRLRRNAMPSGARTAALWQSVCAGVLTVKKERSSSYRLLPARRGATPGSSSPRLSTGWIRADWQCRRGGIWNPSRGPRFEGCLHAEIRRRTRNEGRQRLENRQPKSLQWSSVRPSLPSRPPDTSRHWTFWSK